MRIDPGAKARPDRRDSPASLRTQRRGGFAAWFGREQFGRGRTEAEAIRIVHEALDAGVNFMDNAWEYHDGRSEEWMGKALKGRRAEAFLMSKVCTHGGTPRWRCSNSIAATTELNYE